MAFSAAASIRTSPRHDKKPDKKKAARKLLESSRSPKLKSIDGDPSIQGASSRIIPRLIFYIMPLFCFVLFTFSLLSYFHNGGSSDLYPSFQNYFSCGRSGIPSTAAASTDPDSLRTLQEGKADVAAPLADVAVVLIGQLRQFDLTGPSIAKWLLTAPSIGRPWFEDTPKNGTPPVIDLFIVTPFDDNSYKFLAVVPTDAADVTPDVTSSLGSKLIGTNPGPSLGHVSISFYKEMNINSSAYPWRILYVLDRGPQGLLRQFTMDLAALQRIREHEKYGRGGVPYKWILKTRPDSYWLAAPPSVATLHAAPPPQALQHMDPSTALQWVYAPNGADYGGYNDRLALGESNAMTPLFQRLISLDDVTNRWHTGDLNGTESLVPCLTSKIRPGKLNAECFLRVLLDHVWVKNVTVGRAVFPFCLLSHHSWIKMFSNSYAHPSWGGYYCRPCHLTQDPKDEGMCQNQGEWEEDWEASFEAAAGPELTSRARAITSMSYAQCTLMVEKAKRRMLFGSVPHSKKDPLEMHPAWLGLGGDHRPHEEEEGVEKGTGEGRPMGDWWGPSSASICARRELGPVRPLRKKNITSYAWPLAIQHLRSRCRSPDATGCVMYLLAEKAPFPRQEAAESPLSWEIVLLNLTLSASMSLGPDAPIPGFTSANGASTLGPSKRVSSRRRRMLLSEGGEPKASLVILTPDDEVSVQRSIYLDLMDLKKVDQNLPHQELMRCISVVGALQPTASTLETTMAQRQHSRLDLLKVAAPIVDSLVSSWVEKGRAPVVCQVLMDVGSRRQDGEAVALGTRAELSWSTLVESLSSLGFELDQCNGRDSEKQGQCFWFSPTACVH